VSYFKGLISRKVLFLFKNLNWVLKF